MRVSIIHPISLFSEILPYTDFLLIEAHVYLHCAELRKRLLKERKTLPPIYLDHSAFLLNEPVSLPSYLKIVQELQPDVVFLPDVPHNFTATLRMINEWYDPLIDAKSKHAKVLGCPAGETFGEWASLLDIFSDVKRCDLIGISSFVPKKIEQLAPLSRRRFKVLQLLACWWPQDEWKKFRFHALGLPVLRELTFLRQHPNVESIDTSLPVTAGLRLLPIAKGYRTSLDFNIAARDINAQQKTQIIHNIDALRRACD